MELQNWIRNIYAWVRRKHLYKMNICNRKISTAVYFSVYIVVILLNLNDKISQNVMYKTKE